jgi:hypothetical protein
VHSKTGRHPADDAAPSVADGTRRDNLAAIRQFAETGLRPDIYCECLAACRGRISVTPPTYVTMRRRWPGARFTLRGHESRSEQTVALADTYVVTSS